MVDQSVDRVRAKVLLQRQMPNTNITRLLAITDVLAPRFGACSLRARPKISQR
jgi:hypothetical protein